MLFCNVVLHLDFFVHSLKIRRGFLVEFVLYFDDFTTGLLCSFIVFLVLVLDGLVHLFEPLDFFLQQSDLFISLVLSVP